MLLLDLEIRTTRYCTYMFILCIYNKYWVVQNVESLKNKRA